MGSEIVPHNPQSNGAGMVATQAVGERSLEIRAETASMAIAAQAAATVKARYGMALERPRDMMLVRNRLLAALARPRFAETARYAKPVGSEMIRGWSIRFAEECARSLGNLYPETMVTYDNARQRIIRVSVTDLESNVCYVTDVTVEKTIERRNPKGYEVIGQRTNKRGDTVYIVVATDDDLQNKQNSMVSKAMRNAILRLVPSDILEEALDAYHASLNGETKDPAKALKNLVDGFARLEISVEQLADYLGHPVDKMTADEREALKQIGVAIKEGETTWAAVMAQKAEEAAANDAPSDEAKAEAAPGARPKNLADLKKKEKSAGIKVTVEGHGPSCSINTGADCDCKAAE